MSVNRITGSRFHAGRVLAGLSREALAERAGLCRHTILSWEKSSDAIPAATYSHFCRALDVRAVPARPHPRAPLRRSRHQKDAPDDGAVLQHVVVLLIIADGRALEDKPSHGPNDQTRRAAQQQLKPPEWQQARSQQEASRSLRPARPQMRVVPLVQAESTRGHDPL